MKIAVCVFVVGSAYIEDFEELFKPSLEVYCEKHGYTLVVITELIRPMAIFDRKKFFWQRFLIPGLPEFKDFDYVLTLDADVLVSPNAPSLPVLNPGMIGCVNERKCFGNYDWREMIQREEGFEPRGRDWYRLSGEEKDYDDHIQGGFVLYQPRFHGTLMTRLYEENIPNYLSYHQDDQSFLSSYGIDNELIQWIDERYDMVWHFWKAILLPRFAHYPFKARMSLLGRYIQLNFFCHFPGSEDRRLLRRYCFPGRLVERLPEPIYGFTKRIASKFGLNFN